MYPSTLLGSTTHNKDSKLSYEIAYLTGNKSKKPMDKAHGGIAHGGHAHGGIAHEDMPIHSAFSGYEKTQSSMKALQGTSGRMKEKDSLLYAQK